MAGALEYFCFADKQPIKAVQIMTVPVSQGNLEVAVVKPSTEETGMAGCVGLVASSSLKGQIVLQACGDFISPAYTKLY